MGQQDISTSIPQPPSNPGTRIMDVPLRNTQALSQVAESKLLDEKALSSLDEELTVLEARLQRLKDETATVELLIADTVAKQTRLRSSIATQATFLSSPLATLPDEVLSEIFLHYVALFPPATGSVFGEIIACHRIHAPLLQVCRQWRTTALTDLRLWTTLPLVGSPEQRTEYWEALETRIERSSALPLNILFYLAAKGRDPEYAVSSFETFIRLFPRANTISLDLCPLQWNDLDLTSIAINAKISAATRIHTARVVVDGQALRRKILSAIPNVEILEIDEVNIRSWFLDAPNVANHLRSLYVHSASLPLAEVLDFLDRVPHLETLKLFRVLADHGDIHRVVTHAVVVVSTFQLDEVAEHQNDALFQHLTFPSLRSLSLNAERNWWLGFKWPRQSNIAFLRRSGCALTKLSFLNCDVDERLLMEILQYQKDIITLEFNVFSGPRFFDDPSHVTIPMSILECLSTKPKGVPNRPMPALKVFRLAIWPRQFEPVKQLVQSRSGDEARSHDVAELREVDIVVKDHTASDARKAEYEAIFDAFVNAGMNIQISYELAR